MDGKKGGRGEEGIIMGGERKEEVSFQMVMACISFEQRRQARPSQLPSCLSLFKATAHVTSNCECPSSALGPSRLWSTSRTIYSLSASTSVASSISSMATPSI